MFFATSLFLLVAVKHALGQDDPTIGWDMVEDVPTQDVGAAMMTVPLLGAILGGWRLLTASRFHPVDDPRFAF
jgi:hypothetical protein